MTESSLKPVHKRLLAENVVGAIRSAIFEGELALGQRLVETDLAEQLGVSRGPVREALRLLAAEGLVLINVHRGTFVVRPAAEDVEEIYSLREALEALAIRRVVEVAADKEIASLEEPVERLQAASRHKKIDQMAGLNMEFHGRLFQLARHKRLCQAWSSLESQLRLCNSLAFVWTQKAVSRIHEEHAKIVKAIQSRDAEAACRIMSQHIQKAAELLLESMRSAGRQSSRRS